MEKHHIEHLIQRYLENSITEKDRLELKQLIQSGKAEGLLKDRITASVIEEIRSNRMPDAYEKERSEKIFNSIAASRRPSHRSGFVKVFQYAAALTILGGIGLSLYFQGAKDTRATETLVTTSQEDITIKNSEPKTKKILFPDGSTVLLEPGSEVRYGRDFVNRRDVFLSGEAFFEVTKDVSHPFLVYANEVTTRVLGTSFRIKADKSGKEVVVAVKTGKVSVFTKSADDKFQNTNSAEVTLTPNQQAIYKRSEHIVVKKVVEKPEVIVEHKSLKNTYINEQVVVILKALSESYGVEMRYDSTALSGCTLTSDVIESEGLFDQLDIICSALGGTYELENDASIVINTNGCNK